MAATLERWWFPRAWDETNLLASRFYFGDARAYLAYAAALVNGETFDNGVPFHPPGWPLVLSVLLRLSGWSPDASADILTIKHAVAILSGASVGLAALLALVLAGRGAMVIVSFLGTFHFGHMAQAASPNSEPLYGALMIGVLLCGVWCLGRRPSIALAMAWGVLAGFTTLVRAEFALCVLLLAIAGMFAAGTSARRQVALLLLGFVLALIPTTVLNWRSVGEFNRTREGRMPGPLPRFAPVTSYGAFNFANANHERARGGFNWDLPSLVPQADADAPGGREASELSEAGLLDLSRPAVYRAFVHGYGMGVSWLVHDPAAALRLIRAKLAITLSVFDFGYGLDNVPVTVRGTRRSVDQVDLEFGWLTIAHVSLAAVGLILATRQRWTLLLLAPILTMLVSSAMFFGYVRLGVAYLPIIWILQALAIVRVLERVPTSDRLQRRAIAAAAVLGVMLLLSEAAASDDRRVLMVDGLADEAGNMVEDQPMELTRVR